jgi:hypothetical protein
MQVVHPPASNWLRRLSLAILEEALECVEGRGSPAGKSKQRDVVRRTREALAWVMSDAEHCFSFTTICAVLTLDPAAVRRAVRARVRSDRVTAEAEVACQLQPPLPRRGLRFEQEKVLGKAVGGAR